MPKKDLNQLAKYILDKAIGDAPDPKASKNPKLSERGRKGGLVGGNARAEKLSPEERKKIAADAAKKRWG